MGEKNLADEQDQLKVDSLSTLHDPDDGDLEGEQTLNPTNNGINNIYPQANIKVEREQYSVFELKRKYDKELIILDPEFQRNDVWKIKQKSELIESVLMGIPLPLIYLTETKAGKLVVVDGRQRLTTFFEFLNGKFTLSQLRILQDLNGQKFKQLDAKLQANLEDFQLIAQVIKPPTPDRIKFDIFDRVNRGGTILNNQEMRNALYQGPATELLKELAESEMLKKATDHSIKPIRMKDRYIVLRFLAFYLWKKKLLTDADGALVEYKSDIDDFLGKSMEFINRADHTLLAELKEVFYRAMNNSFNIIGENCFRLPMNTSIGRPVNMALFESLSYLFAHEEVINKKIEVNHIYQKLISNEQFIDTLTLISVDSSVKVKERFEFMDRTLRELVK